MGDRIDVREPLSPREFVALVWEEGKHHLRAAGFSGPLQVSFPSELVGEFECRPRQIDFAPKVLVYDADERSRVILMAIHAMLAATK